MRIVRPIPKSLYLACSGGIDSMFAYHFLKTSRRDVTCLFFNHGTETSRAAEDFLSENVNNLIVESIGNPECPKGVSVEAWWRSKRYEFFSRFCDKPIITCHHLDDQVENWIMTSTHGLPRLIPYSRGNFLRPFVLCKKSEIIDYCVRHKVNYSQDLSNFDVKYSRNRIRHNVVPELLKVNPGLYTVVGRFVSESINIAS